MTQLEMRSSEEMVQASQANWKTTWMAAGGLVGALLGVAAVYFYIRSVEAESGAPAPQPRPIKPGAAIQIALSVLSTIKQFANLGVD